MDAVEYPSVIPMLAYEDGVAAMEWLAKAFGFRERARYTEAMVYVDDLEAHIRRAREVGATILSEIEDDPPGRRYRAEDLEGHRWFFFERSGD